jgi:hypothetical protein
MESAFMGLFNAALNFKYVVELSLYGEIAVIPDKP